MRCDLHCPTSGKGSVLGLLLFLLGLLAAAGVVAGVSNVLLDASLNAAVDAVFQVVVAVAAGGVLCGGAGVGVFLAVDRVQSRAARREFAAHNARLDAARDERLRRAEVLQVSAERVPELPAPAPVVEPVPVNLDALLQDRAS